MIKNGDVYGIYTVLCSTDKTTKDGHRIYLVECNVCHKRFERASNKFAYGTMIVNKCMHDISNANAIKSKRMKSIYRKMHRRCYNPKDADYHIYGGRGIYICDEWLNDPKQFEKWAKRNGYKKHLTIDRIDSNGPYAPWNCRWITRNDNAKFRRITNVISVNNITDSGRGWSTRLGIGINDINKLCRDHGKKFVNRYITDKLDGFEVLIPK